MVRAGEGGYLADEFAEKALVAIGWAAAGDFTNIGSLEEMRQRILESDQEAKRGAVANSASMAWKFRQVMSPGDRVVTYNPRTREYLLGTIESEYSYSPGAVTDYHHVRSVRWDTRVSRDELSPSSRNTLGSTLTIFEPGPDVIRELEQPGSACTAAPELGEAVETEEEWLVIRRDVLGVCPSNLAAEGSRG